MDGEAQAEAAVEEEDDFATAYEILDLARVLLEQQLEARQETEQNGIATDKGKEKAEQAEMSSEMRHIKERLADTRDLQAEISLENERFADAIGDSRAAAALIDELHPRSSSLVAEAHYKLSLALEFESVTSIREAQAKEEESSAANAAEQPQVDERLRDEAAKEMEIAVDSCKLRLASEEQSSSGLEGEAAKAQQKGIAEVKEIIEEMEQRVSYPATVPDIQVSNFHSLSISGAH